MLNAKKLVKAVKDAKHDSTEELVEARTVTKLLDWDGLYRDLDTETRVTSLLQPLVLPRVSVKSSLSEAVWDEDRGQVVITRNTGKVELGPVLPEEALFLLENNCLHLARSGVPLSLQSAFSLLMSPETGLTLDMYLVYSKLTRDGYKLVRCREGDHYEARECDNIENLSGQPVDSDIDSKMIQPLFGFELLSLSRHYTCSSSLSWMKDLLGEIINRSVEASYSNSRKRKAEDPLISDDTAKQQKCVPVDNHSLHLSPKYEADLDPDDILEVIDVEDENEKARFKHNANVFINPFHQENEEEGEDDSTEEIDNPVVDLDGDDDDILITSEQDTSVQTFSTVHQENVTSQQNMTSLVASAIRMQVTAAEAMYRELQAAALPTKLLEGPNQHLCKLCDVVCNTPEVLKIHEEGKKHKRKMLRMKATAGASEGQCQLVTEDSFSCDICGISCTDGTALVAHLNGKRHLKAMTNRAELNSGSANAARLSGGDSPDNDIMIVTDKCPQPLGMTSDDADDDIELITGDEKTKDEMLFDLPNCDPRRSLQLIKPLMYLIPPNTWAGSKISRDINVSELFKSSASNKSQPSSVDSSVGALFFIDTRPKSHEEISLLDDDDDEIILVEEETQKKKKKVATPLSRPFRGLYPAKEYVTPLASVDGVFTTIRNFGFHIKPPKPKPLNIPNKRPLNVKQYSKNVAKNIKVREVAEDVMGISGCDESMEAGKRTSDEQIDFQDLAARAKAWMAQCNERKVSEKKEANCDKNVDTGEKPRKHLTAEAKDEGTEKNQKVMETLELVELGSSDEEMDDLTDRSDSSSSYYSDDISAHSELRYFKHGPLAPLWSFDDKVGPLICPEMSGSMREIYNRIRMEPPEPHFKGSDHGVEHKACYDVFLAENYKKNSRTPPNYRIVIQDFSSSLPTVQLMCNLDRKYPDLVPFLFAILSGGTVSFFNVDRMALLKKDSVIPKNSPKDVLLDLHKTYISKYGDDPDDYEYAMSEFLRMNGLYWGVAVMDLMRSLDTMDRENIVKFVMECQDPETGGFRPVHDHDPHILNTLSAVQVAIMLDCVDKIDVEGVVKYVKSLQLEDGSFTGDKWGEVDNRFCFCAVATLSLLGRLDAVDTDLTAKFVQSCQNFDGGFGSRVGAESHAGLIYTCLGTLAITGHLHTCDQDRLGWWLAERQLPSGGLNGRPEKLPDVCYSWWVLASLAMLGRLHWIDKQKMVYFILACQDNETGGFADRPGDVADPFHTLFGVAGLSLLGEEADRVKRVNPVFCMPQEVLDKNNVTHQILE